jgi:phosphonopyruvate decarboxylase
MIQADDFLKAALNRDYRFYTGVPCSFLTPLINRTIGDSRIDYVGATQEGEAVGIAAGAWLAGKRAMVMCQNSGLGNMINPLTSLNYPFRIPALLIVTWRGQPTLKDEPQHELMGRITQDLLGCIGVRHRRFPQKAGDIAAAMAEAEATIAETSLPFCMVMAQGDVADSDLDQPPPAGLRAGQRDDLTRGGARPTRYAALERFLAAVPDEAAVIATTGKCGRELFTLADRPQHLYLVGSMGGASAVGLGLALNTGRRVVVLDGDGAALMKLGNMTTIGSRQPHNLLHIILDNGTHDSTGGQATVSPGVDFAAIARGCGYRRATVCDDLTGFDKALGAALLQSGPELIHLRIKPGSLDKLGRPTVAPRDVARRFKDFVTTEALVAAR